MTSDDIIACPRLCARLTREACYLRQLRCRHERRNPKPWKPYLSPRDAYCAEGECGLGEINWRAFKRGTLKQRPPKKANPRHQVKKPTRVKESP